MATTDFSEPQLLRMGEVAKWLNVSRTTAYQMAADGTLPGLVRLGRAGTYRVNAAVLREWIDRKAEQVA